MRALRSSPPLAVSDMPVPGGASLRRSTPARPPRRPWFWASVAILGLGAGLRVWQYVGNPSLWIDEIALARSVIELPVGSLVTSPLYFNQGAPIGFLLLENVAVWIGGTSELALRALPLVAGLAALPLFFLLARRVLRSPGAVFFATAIFAIGPNLILRSAEVKPYSFDVAAGIAITLAAVAWLSDPTPRRGLGLSLAIGVLAWFSHGAVIVGGAVLLAVTLSRWNRAPARGQLLAAGLPALASLVLAALVAREQVPPEGRDYLLAFWRNGFIPWEPGQALAWFRDQLPEPLRVNFRLDADLARVYLALVPLGWLALARRRRGIAAVIAAPMLAALAGAALWEYPFADRLVTFLTPVVVLAIAAAIEPAYRWTSRLHPAVGVVALSAALAPIALPAIEHRPVLRRQEAKPVLTSLAQRRESGEPVYVYFAGWQSLAYYADRVGLDPRGVFVGGCHVGRPEGYAADLDRFAGARRLWVFMTHERNGDRAIILDRLRRIGTIQDSLVVPTAPPSARAGASLYSVDLSAARPSHDRIPDSGANPECHPAGPEFPVDSLIRGGRTY